MSHIATEIFPRQSVTSRKKTEFLCASEQQDETRSNNNFLSKLVTDDGRWISGKD
jgi:hypothetical protein